MPEVFGQTNSDPDEIIWTEESINTTDNKAASGSAAKSDKEKEELFDEEERDSGILRFLNVDEDTESIDVINVEVFDENDENPIVKDIIAAGKRPTNSGAKSGGTDTIPDNGEILFFDENNDFVTEAKLKEKEKAKNSAHRAETAVKTDTIAAYVKKQVPKLDYVPFDDRTSFGDTIIVNPIFMPFVFDGEVLPDDYQLYDPDLHKKGRDFSYHYTTAEDPLFKKEKTTQKIHHDLRNYVTLNNPTDIKYSTQSLPNDIPVAVEITRPSLLTRLIEIDEAPIVNSGSPDGFVPKIKYWLVKGNSSVQFSQNYLSPNWAAGANSSVNLISVNELTADYDNKKRFIFTNYLLYRLSLTNAQGDTMHTIRIGEDVFRYKPKIGLKAAKNNKWYYTISGTLETQFLKNYQSNSNTLNTAFLAPLVANIGLGMDYKTTKTFPADKYKILTIHANLAPISITYKYTNRPELNLTGYGFKPDQRSFYKVGTTVDINTTCNFTRFIRWDSKLYLFTTYKDVDMYFENTFDFAINRYFSTRIYLNLKYNSASERYEKKAEEDKNYPHTRLQMNELISFGFNYTW